ncbi:MAG: hypothetical protein JW893_04785, partial [Candidatus Omnitrophica bacterium]|nr:hypothetical protein [Candidatus Omnitrophota bacterium]
PLGAMRYYLQHSMEEAIRLSLSSQTETDLENIMDRFFFERLRRNLKSRSFLEKIKPQLQTA